MAAVTCSPVLKILLVNFLLYELFALFTVSVYSPTMEHAGYGMSGLLPWSQLSSMGCVCKVCLDWLNFHGLVLCIFLIFSPIGIYFASCSHDNTARLWSSDTVYPLRVFVGHLSGVDVSREAIVAF